MKYLLDTDHLIILQRQAGQDYINLSTRMARNFGKVKGLSIEDWVV